MPSALLQARGCAPIVLPNEYPQVPPIPGAPACLSSPRTAPISRTPSGQTRRPAPVGLKGGSRWGWLDRAVRKHGRSGRRKHEGRMWLSTHG